MVKEHVMGGRRREAGEAASLHGWMDGRTLQERQAFHWDEENLVNPGQVPTAKKQQRERRKSSIKTSWTWKHPYMYKKRKSITSLSLLSSCGELSEHFWKGLTN